MTPLAEYPTVGDAPHSAELILVAFASSDGVCVNQHFGSAECFIVYEISDTSAVAVSTKSFAEEQQDGNEDKLKVKLDWLNGCDVLVCAQVGQSAAQQILRRGTQPIAVKGEPQIQEVLTQLQSDLRSGASWTRRLKRARPEGSTNPQITSLADSWQED